MATKKRPKKQPAKKGKVGGTKVSVPAPAQPAPPTVKIHSRAVLVRFSISAWMGRKFDREITDEITRQRNAVPDAIRATKKLLGGAAPSHSAALSAAGAARNAHYEQTLPWKDDGWRLLPSANFMEYTERMREHRQKFDAASDEFCKEYPTLVTQARSLLNKAFRDADYPAPSTMRDKFDMQLDFAPVPQTGDFRLDLPKEQLSEIEATAQAQINHAVQTAMTDAWGRLYETVRSFRERLQRDSDPEKRPMKRSWIMKELRSIVDVLQRLNVTDDPNLEAMRQRVEQELASQDVDELRDDATVRDAVADQAGEIIEQMSQFFAPPAVPD